MINEEEVRKVIEEIDPEGKIPPDRVEELILSLKELEKNPPKNGDPVPGIPGAYYGVLEEQIKNEKDWRKKASLTAKLISHRMELDSA